MKNEMLNEKFNELLDKLGIELCVNHSMTVDEILDCIGCHVCTEDNGITEVGEIVDEDGNPTGIWYDELVG